MLNHPKSVVQGRKFSCIAFVAGMVAMLAVVFAVKASTTLIGSMVSLNGTTNSTATAYGTYLPQRPTVLISYNTLSNTTALSGVWQISVDNTNFLTTGTPYTPSGAAANTDTYTPTVSNITIYARLQLVSTNAVTVGAVQTQ